MTDFSPYAGIKFRYNFVDKKYTWAKYFISPKINDLQALSNWLYSSSDDVIYSLTILSVSNFAVLYTLKADNGALFSNSIKFSVDVIASAGMILISENLYFVIQNSSQSFLVKYNTIDKNSTSYTFDSTITIYSVKLTKDSSR